VIDALLQQPVTAMLARQLRRATAGVMAASAIEWLPAHRPAIMGILNVTPDSFYDGGAYTTVDAALEQAERMLTEGADVIDVGGESTRPGAEPVAVDEEIARVVPVIEALRAQGVPVSVDTRKAAVADAALRAGAQVVNDVSGLRDPEMPGVVAAHDADLVVMHSIATPVDPSRQTVYDDVVTDVLDELTEQVLLAERAGVDRERIIVDPGCGFGKSPAESYRLIDRLGELAGVGLPVLIGHSRKSMFAEVTADAGDRLAPTLAMSALAADRGAGVLRVHDVGANRTVVDAVAAMQAARRAEVQL
jgi:dihydropteroate synthase